MPITTSGNSTDFRAGNHSTYDPSLEYDYHQTVQVWVGKDKIAVGNTIGANLYVTVWNLLDRACPSNTRDATCVNDALDICFKTVTMTKDGRPADSTFKIPRRTYTDIDNVQVWSVSTRYVQSGEPNSCANCSSEWLLVHWKP